MLGSFHLLISQKAVKTKGNILTNSSTNNIQHFGQRPLKGGKSCCKVDVVILNQLPTDSFYELIGLGTIPNPSPWKRRKSLSQEMKENTLLERKTNFRF